MAIQVSGTQVIGNSRELTNIASIDTTTKNAISAAGVGGLTTLIADNVSPLSSNNQVIATSLGNYRSQTFSFMLKGAGGWTGRIQMRLTDSSGTTLTGNYQWTQQSADSLGSELSDNRIIIWKKEPLAAANSDDHYKFDITFTDAYSSSLATGIRFMGNVKDSSNNSGGNYGAAGHGVIQRNQSFILYFENSTAWSSATKYSSWGIA